MRSRTEVQAVAGHPGHDPPGAATREVSTEKKLAIAVRFGKSSVHNS
jgi:hypothetical protein